jgi:hypothetical protein
LRRFVYEEDGGRRGGCGFMVTMIRRQGWAQGETFPRIGGRSIPAVFAMITEAFAGIIFPLDFGPPVGFVAPHERRGQGR